MKYNEIEKNALGKLKVLSNIDELALLERKKYDDIKEYIIASGFNMENKDWRSGSYYDDFGKAIEEYTERVLASRNIELTQHKLMKKLYDQSNEVRELAYSLDNPKVDNDISYSKYDEYLYEIEIIKEKFDDLTCENKELKNYLNNKNISNHNITTATAIMGGIDLRNAQRKCGNLDGSIEKYPYKDEEIKLINAYNEIQNDIERMEQEIEEVEI